MWSTLAKDSSFLALAVVMPVVLIGVAVSGASSAPPALWTLIFLALVTFGYARGVGALHSVRERAFWTHWTLAFAIWTLAVLLELVLEVVYGPEQATRQYPAGVWIDALRLLGFVPIFLALDLRPHRGDDGNRPGLVRQLQLAGFLLMLVGLALYGLALPAAIDSSARMSNRAFLVVGVFLGLFFGWMASQRSAHRWRVIYGLLAAGFAVQVVGGLVSPPVAGWLAALSWLPFLAAARSRLLPAAGPQHEPPAARWVLRFDMPLVITLAILPAIHLVLITFMPAPGPLQQARGSLVLLSILVLGPLAFIEHSRLRKRSSFLEREQARAAEEMLDRSMFLDSLIEHSPLAIVVLDPDHRVRICNPAFEKLFQWDRDEVVGTTLDRMISTSQKRREASDYTELVLEGRTVHDTTRRLRKDGTELDVELYGVPLMRGGELIGIFAIYQDVTDRVRAEQALRESEERFRRLSDATFEGIVVSDGEEILDCNEQYARMLQLEVESVVGRPLLDFVAPDDRQLVQSYIDDAYEEPYEHRALRADNSELIVEVHGRSLPMGGRTVRVTAVRDMTDNRRFEEEVRQSQKMEAVGRLAGGIAHDFNNLLTVIKGYGQLLTMQITEPKLRGLVEEILQASERASLMTQRLLAFGRKQSVQSETLDLNQVIAGMEKILRRLIRADIDIDLHLSKGLGKIRADPSQVEQVILNLVINAGDAMPKGGILSIESSDVELTEDDAREGYTSAGSFVCLRVSDTGMGMDEATLAQVFEPFFTTKEKGKGTGLGLATVYAIIKQSSGSIDVESKVGRGTTFRIYFPRVPDVMTGDSMDAPSARTNLPRSEGETVLVVEDEPGVRALAVEFLELHGYRVIEARDGREGLEWIEVMGDAIDLVLSDVVMPNMNGPEMVAHLHRRHPDAKVLYMSGYTDEVLGQHHPMLTRLLVQKPFSVEELVLKVREVLDGGRAPEDDADEALEPESIHADTSGDDDQAQA